MKAPGRGPAGALAATLLLAGFAGNASAGSDGSSWSRDHGPGPGLIVSVARSYTHDAGTHGTRPGTDALTMTMSGAYGGSGSLTGSWRLDPRGYRQVREPGTLALLAIGLIGTGMGVALSRRRSQKK